MKDSLIVFGGLVGAPVVRLEATVDIVPLTEVGSHFRQTADAQSAGEFQLEPFIVGQVDDHGSSSRQVNSGASSGSLRIG
jgi:hypothetical protein